MKRPDKIAVVGAGGIACALMPVLSRLTNTVLIDADEYKPENSSRQFPALKHSGNKAEVLAEMLQPHTLYSIGAIPEWLEGPQIMNHPLFHGTELIIGCVDNNESRHLIIELAGILDIPAFLAGNESEHGECHAYYPGLYDPATHHDFTPREPAPFHCNSDQTIKEFPQTPIANALAAAATLHLLSSYERVGELRHAVVYSRIDPLGSRFARALEFEPKKA